MACGIVPQLVLDYSSSTFVVVVATVATETACFNPLKLTFFVLLACSFSAV